jgi:tRNA(His) 5'-end guanylyltransferase
MENTILDFMSDACLKLISTKGISIVVARALEDPSSLLFKDITISFAGDDLT